MKILSAAALGTLVPFCGAAAAKVDFEPVGCSSTSFVFADAAYISDSERSKDPLRIGQSSGSATSVPTTSPSSPGTS